MFILTTSVLISFILSFKRRMEVNYAQSPILATSFIITVLYLNSIYTSLNFGYFILLILGIISVIDNIIFVKYYRFKLRNNEVNSFLCFLLLVLFLSLVSLFVELGRWDEFSHWGTHAKYIFLNSALYDSSIDIVHKSYPVGSALFYFIFLKYSTFSESVLYFAQSLLLLLPLACFIYPKNEAYQKVIFKLFVLIVILTIFGVRIGPTGSLYMDHIVAIYFGCCLVYYVNSKKTFKEIILIIFILVSFLQFKDSLLVFSFLIIGFIAIDQMVLFFSEKNNLSLLKILFILLLLSTVSILSVKIWENYLESISIERTWSINKDFLTIIAATIFPTEEYHQTIFNNFLKKLFEYNSIDNRITVLFAEYFPPIKFLFDISPFQFILNQFFLVILIFVLNKKTEYKVFLYNFILITGYFFYLYGLLILYNFSFGTYEGPRLASFGRYQGIYQIGWVLFNLNFLFRSKIFINLELKNIFIKLSWIPIILTLASLCFVKIYTDKFSNTMKPGIQELRKRFHFLTNKVIEATDVNSKIKIIWQNSNGLEIVMLSYDLFPRFVRGGSFGKPYINDDVWTRTISKENFHDNLYEYDYILLAYTDEKFWKEYGDIFFDLDRNFDYFINYELCISEFASFHKFEPGCQDSTEKAYLIEIKKTDGNLSFVAIK